MADVTSTFNSLSSTESSNAPLGTTVIGSGLDENLRMIQAHTAAWRDQTGWAGLILTSVAGTNTITATLATAGSVTFGPTSLAANQRFILTPANTNTGATTLNITSPNGGSALGAKNVFWNGAACAGGELVQNAPVELLYDGTQFNILGVAIGARLKNSLGADVNLNNIANYFDGPSCAQGTTGTWFASGTVTFNDPSSAATIKAKLWDGTSVIAATSGSLKGAGDNYSLSLSGYISSPAGNIRISAKSGSTTSVLSFNATGESKDCTLSVVRIG